MKDWYKKPAVLWSIISALFVGLVAMIALNQSYGPEINRLRLENQLQDSTITFQRIDIERLTNRLNQKDSEVQSLQTALKYLPD